MNFSFEQTLLTDLYRKQIWNDAKTVNVIASGCFTKITKVITIALQFFAGKDKENESENESESDVSFCLNKNENVLVVI